MAESRFDVPVLCLLSIHQGDSALVVGCGIGGKDRVAQTVAGVHFIGNSGFSEDGQVDVLRLECPTNWNEAAVPAILDVVSGQIEAWWAFGRLLLLGHTLERRSTVMVGIMIPAVWGPNGWCLW